MKGRHLSILVLAGVICLALAGCGGGGGTSSTGGTGGGTGGSGGTGGTGGAGGTGGSTVAGASFSIAWPARSRDALTSPASALSVAVVFKGALSDGSDFTVTEDRDITKPDAYTGTYTLSASISTATKQLTATFYSQPSTGGVVVASATSAINASTKNLSLSTIALKSSISSVAVVGTVQANPKGKPVQLSFSATNTSKQTVALTPGSAVWSLVSGTAATISPDGILTPKSKGKVVVQVSVDGIKITQSISISPYVGSAYTAYGIANPNGLDVAYGYGLNSAGVSLWRGAKNPGVQGVGNIYTFSEGAGEFSELVQTTPDQRMLVPDIIGMDDSGNIVGSTFNYVRVVKEPVTLQVGSNAVPAKIFTSLNVAPYLNDQVTAIAPNGTVGGGAQRPSTDGSDNTYIDLIWASSVSATPNTSQEVYYGPNGVGAAVYLPGSINNSGAYVSGQYYKASYNSASIAVPDPPRIAAAYPDTGIRLYKINNNGDILGVTEYSYSTPWGGYAMWIWHGPYDTNPTRIMPPAGTSSSGPFDMNDSDVVIGDSDVGPWIADSTGTYVITPVYDPATALLGTYFAPRFINNSGLIAGVITLPNGPNNYMRSQAGYLKLN